MNGTQIETVGKVFVVVGSMRRCLICERVFSPGIWFDFCGDWRKVKSQQHLHRRQTTPSLTFIFFGVEYENGTPPAPE
jgi:hypothetical protein